MKKMVYLTLLIGVVSRFLYLDLFPPGLNHDDLELLLSAKTIASRGEGASGTSLPEFLVANKLESGTTGFPSLLLSPLFLILPLSLFTSHLVFTLINLATGLAFALFVYKLSKNKLVALLFLGTY